MQTQFSKVDIEGSSNKLIITVPAAKPSSFLVFEKCIHFSSSVIALLLLLAFTIILVVDAVQASSIVWGKVLLISAVLLMAYFFLIRLSLAHLNVLLWWQKGIEIIEIDNKTLRVVRRPVLGFNKSSEYLADHVQGLHVIGHPPLQLNANQQSLERYIRRSFMERIVSSFRSVETNQIFFGITGGAIVFDYQGRRIQIGNGASEGDAKHIIEKIQKTFPSYAT